MLSRPTMTFSIARLSAPGLWLDLSMRAESIGVMVNATKSEIATAKETVRPNWKKKRPMMPFMVATGTKTAMIEAVIAKTARPISAVRSEERRVGKEGRAGGGRERSER